MSRPTRTTITYDAEGKVAGVSYQSVRQSTADFGDGAEPVEKVAQDQLPISALGAATKAAAQALLDAFEDDLAAERQRIATITQAAADKAAADAQQAADRAAQ